jgi:curli biogenesis system outer membrane secretion channel CsgG
MLRLTALIALLALAGCTTDATRPTTEQKASSAKPAADVPLISREALFGNPSRTGGQSARTVAGSAISPRATGC